MATLWLVGMMGVGKSTVGPLVAALLGRPFIDLDDVIRARAGLSIPDVFAAEGEAGFRRREAAALRATAGSEAVVACGGGVVVDEGNVALLRRSGRVAWLSAPAEVLERRVGDGAGRPLAGTDGAEVGRRLAARAAGYAAAADWEVATAGRSPQEVAEEVVQRWSEST